VHHLDRAQRCGGGTLHGTVHVERTAGRTGSKLPAAGRTLDEAGRIGDKVWRERNAIAFRFHTDGQHRQIVLFGIVLIAFCIHAVQHKIARGFMQLDIGDLGFYKLHRWVVQYLQKSSRRSMERMSM